MNRQASTIVLDVAGMLLAGRGNRLRRIAALSDVPGDKWVVSDFDGADPVVVTVEAKPAFAASVAEQELRRSGDLDTGGSLVVHRVRRRGERASEVLGTLVPPGVEIQRQCDLQADEACVLAFPIQAVFARALDALRPRRPLALMVIGDRHADVLVGDQGRTYGAFRSSLARTSAGDTATLVPTIRMELQRIERECGIRLGELRWGCLLADTGSPPAAWVGTLAEDLGIPARRLPASRLRVDGETKLSVLPGMIRRLGPSASSSSRSQVGLWRMNFALPRVAVAMLVLTGFAAWSLYEDSVAVNRMDAEIRVLEGALHAPEAVAQFDSERFEERLSLAEGLIRAGAVPPLRSVMADVAEAAEGRDTYLRDLRVEYADRAISVALSGRTNKRGGADPMPTYTAFMDALRGRGYAVVESDLNTGTEALSFSTRLTKVVVDE